MTNDAVDARTRAIEALTELASRTGDDGYIAHDFGETVCDIVSTVAANVGSLDTLLQGRPGSWEADLVRQMVESTIPEEDLLTYRTEPIRLMLNIEDRWFDLGLQSLYLDDLDAIDALKPADTGDEDEPTSLDLEENAIYDLYEADRTAYVAAWTEEVRKIAAERGITVPVEVTVVRGNEREPMWDDLAEQLHGDANERTPHPGSGIAPKDYQRPEGAGPDWRFEDVERAAGRSYRDRVAAAADNQN
jgi:hypothetical protein